MPWPERRAHQVLQCRGRKQVRIILPRSSSSAPLLADLHRQQPLRRGGSNWRTLRTIVSHRFLGRLALEAASSKNDELLEKVAELELLLETAKATTSNLESEIDKACEVFTLSRDSLQGSLDTAKITINKLESEVDKKAADNSRLRLE